MIITLTPMRRDAALQLERDGDKLSINGELFDFSEVPEGATLPMDAIASDWFADDVNRLDGQLRLTLILPLGADANLRDSFAIDDPADGPVALYPEREC